MKVRILRSFVGYVGKTKHRCQAGEVVDLPNGADWVRIGFAEVTDEVAEKPRKAKKGNA